MKRTFAFFSLLSLEFLLLLLNLISYIPYSVLFLFIFNVLFFILLILEPYWKKGAALCFFVFILINFHIFNFLLLDFRLFLSNLISLLMVLFGLVVVFLAHHMKKREREFFINEAGEDTIESFDRPEKVNTELLILVEKDRTIHLKNCKILKDIPDKEQKILGSRRYAKSKGYKPCKECGPF